MRSLLKPARAIALPVALALLAACGGKQAPPPPAVAPPPLETFAVHAQTLASEQGWDGVVEAVHQATISAQTAGRVVELPYDVNDFVAEGAVIVRFTDVEQKSVRNRAQAQIASAQAAYDEAQASYQRVAEIFARKLLAKAQLDQELARRDAARAALNAAQAASREVGQQLDYTVVRAPYAGIVTRRYVQVGEAVQPGQPLIAGVSLKDLRVNVQVPQSAVAAIRRWHRAEVLLDGSGQRRIAADKVTVFPYADPDTHSFSVRLELADDDPSLFPGMTVKVAFATGTRQQLRVPVSTLVQRGELVGVYVIDAHGAALRQVRSGDRHGEDIELLAGIEDGEHIATDPQAAARWLAAQHAKGTP